MGLMTAHAVLTKHLKMTAMLANKGYILMTSQTISCIWLYLCVRLMAFIAIKLHWCILWDMYLLCPCNGLLCRCKVFHIYCTILNKSLSYAFICAVAEETFVPSRFKVNCPVCMAVYTCKGLHTSMDFPVLMAIFTELFLWKKSMDYIAMAL